ncbi:uncharacterized protein DEA37_0003391 [Paragonimus westermani]|uniref:Uncharacterized protein n=1 Tax=Paragonimus westermani TaxID=34504 RepID=A0A5J4NGN0_9TREM|nr:uncharacterized protein DEA37_0003391 [Paragonimus westermani]
MFHVLTMYMSIMLVHCQYSLAILTFSLMWIVSPVGPKQSTLQILIPPLSCVHF